MELIDNRYQINGIDVLGLAEKYGLPLYVYDTAKMQAQYDRLTKAFQGVDLRINYACKALTNINVLKFFNKLGSGLDAVSIQEVRLGLKAGFNPKDIMFTPNCVSLSEIEEGVDLGVHINIDNLSILEQFGHKYGNTIPVYVRLNPHIMAGGNNKISTGHIDSKFGISIYQMPHLLRVIETNKMQVEGLHMHTGSDILDVDVFLRGTEILLNEAKNFKELKYIDFGSGFKVSYKPDDYSTDIEAMGKKLTKKFKEFCREYGRDLTLAFEPGKFLVSEAGYFLARVNVVKQTTATVFAGLDTGLNHLIRPMFYDSYHDIFNISKPEGNTRIYTVSEGDVLAFRNAGAYCFSMSSNYNSRYRPAEVLIHEGNDYLIRNRESMEDILRNQVEVDI